MPFILLYKESKSERRNVYEYSKHMEDVWSDEWSEYVSYIEFFNS